MANYSRITPGPNQDNTGRNFAYDYQTPIFAAVINIVPLQYDTLVVPATLTGNATINLGVGTASTPPCIGDALQILASSTSAVTLTLGTGIAASNYSLAVAAGKFSSISFLFNGTAWVEVGRCVGA